MHLFKTIDRDAELYRWVVKHVPKSHIYVEPLAGAISLFWFMLKPFPSVVINDPYVELVWIYRVLQDIDKYNAIIEKLAKTPFSQDEFNQAVKMIKNPNSDDINKTWAYFVIHNEYLFKLKKGDPEFENFLNNLSNDLPLRLKLFVYWRDRLSSAQIDCVDAMKCIKYWDTPDTVFYIDPPYDLDAEFYKNLVDTLLSVNGKVLLFGYEQPAYKSLLETGWQKLHNDTLHCNDVLYLNFRKCDTSGNIEKQKVELFDL